MSLQELRRAIRLGFTDEAEKHVARMRQSNKDVLIEGAYLKLLKFEQPEIPLSAVSPQGKIRLLALQAAQLNRARDPLRALALLSDAKPPDTACRVDVLFETARVYSWLGNEKLAAENLTQVLALDVEAQVRFLALFRLGNLYAEVERFALAQRYLSLAAANSKGMEKSVYFAQFQECSARVDMALGGDASKQRAWLAKNAAKLPAYLKFRAEALEIEADLHNLSTVMPAQAGTQFSPSPAAAKLDSRLRENDGVSGGFEKQMLNVLSARFDLLKHTPMPAIEKLKAARDWFTDEDLATRLIQSRLLLAQAYAMNGAVDEAALELDQTRSYCVSRGMIVQQENVERAFAELNLTLNPIIESKRNSGEGAWKDAQAYVLIKRLGEGGQAQVYLAHDNARGRSVAYKKMKGADLEALSREVRLANAAQVSGVAKILACGTAADGSLYMVQEFVEGQSLRKLIDAKQAQISHSNQLQSILAKLHAAKIIHGDVKPENVIVNGQGQVTLVDFGLAQSGNHKAIGATPIYAPPRLALRNTSPPWRDQYALGLVMIECCGAALPQRQQSMADLFRVAPALKNIITNFKADIQKTILRLLRPY